jgi:hypothetical protein
MTHSTPTTAAEFRKAAQEERQRAEFQRHFTRLVSALAMLPLVSYVLMLAAGAAHGVVDEVPPLGYGATLLLVLGADALSLVAKKFRK